MREENKMMMEELEEKDSMTTLVAWTSSITKEDVVSIMETSNNTMREEIKQEDERR